MSKKVKVILLEKAEGCGEAGDIVEVAEGYARNFLFPAGKAALATEQVEAKVKKEKVKEEHKQEQQLIVAQNKAEQLEGTELILSARVKKGDNIFGRITAREVARELKRQANLEVTKKEVTLAEQITKLGRYDAQVNLGEGVEVNLKVVVEPDANGTSKEDEK